MKMKNRYYVYMAAILGLALFVRYDLTRRSDLASVAAVSSLKSAATSMEEPAASSEVAAAQPVQVTNAPQGPSFAEKFRAEAAEIGKLQMDPESVEERLRDLARSMNQQDVADLYEVISDDTNDPDHRALAVELLSIKNDTASLTALQNFVANKKMVNGRPWDSKKELETVLRAQAVESIAAYPQKEIALSTLSFLQRRVDERFLNDRIGRAAANLNGVAPAAEQQDDEALRKLLE